MLVIDFLPSLELHHLNGEANEPNHPTLFTDGFVSLFLWLGQGLVAITFFHYEGFVPNWFQELIILF
ncbi:MAG: hypothetical protein OXC61_09865 [Flavobacteriaceae bacterium]|nr:hypothetical protein [Flavobacteriaceae bacterium]